MMVKLQKMGTAGKGQWFLGTWAHDQGIPGPTEHEECSQAAAAGRSGDSAPRIGTLPARGECLEG